MKNVQGKTPQTMTATSPRRNDNRSIVSRWIEAILTRREVLLVILIIVMMAWMVGLSFGGYMTGPFDIDYIASSLVDAAPIAMLALAQLLVMASGRGGIDLSVGAIVSFTSMAFGFAYELWNLPLSVAVLLAVIVGALLGLINGILIAVCNFPALIATLATYYVFKSLAVVMNAQKPISGERIQDLYSLTGDWEIPLIGAGLPNIPLGVVVFLIPAVVVVWLLLQRTIFGRKLFAIGTNEVAAKWAGLDVSVTRMLAYVFSGVLSGLVAVYLTSQFASARPDAGTSGNGLALPAIAIAVLGGVAITGGRGKVSGVVLAALLVVWLDAGLLLLFEGNQGTQLQLFALGAVLIFASVLNAFTARKYGGTR